MQKNLGQPPGRALDGVVTVVTGASRGAGRGIAVELGAAGATVYVTGRSVRGQPAPGYERMLAHLGREAMPGSIDETAEEVTRRGGRDRTWCHTGVVLRRRKSGVVEVTDPDAAPKKS